MPGNRQAGATGRVQAYLKPPSRGSSSVRERRTGGSSAVIQTDRPGFTEKFRGVADQPGRRRAAEAERDCPRYGKPSRRRSDVVLSLFSAGRLCSCDGSWSALKAEAGGEAQADLEKKVEQRTAELTIVNKALHEEVGERTRAESELRTQEERLKIYARELERSNLELEQFASVASHDLQEPLRKIQAFGDRLRAHFTQGLPEQAADYLARMLAAAGRMRALIDDLLTYSRIARKGRTFAPVDLAEVARDVVSDLDGRLQTTGGRVEVGSLPTVTADKLQMRQLLQNLIANALKFRKPEETPVVHIAGRVDARPCSRIHLGNRGSRQWDWVREPIP